MEAWGLARALHVLGVVLWIGGVAMVTTVLLPAVRRLHAEGHSADLVERVEHRFSFQAKWTTLLVGATGFYLTAALGLWPRFAELRYWWMTAMVVVWALFTLILFVLEPLFLHRWFAERVRRDGAAALRLAERLHWVLLAASLATIAGTVAGAHGALFP